MPAEDYFQQQNEMCKKHQNLKLALFCRICSTAVCSLCALVSHRVHDILHLEDVYQAKKDQITAALADLKTSEEKSEVYTRRLAKQNKTLGYMKKRLLQDIDSSYENCIAMLSDTKKQLKEDVISNVAEQQADRNEQMEMVVQCNDSKTQHSLYCQQALSYVQAVHFIEMSEDLEKETRRLVEIPQLLDMKIEEVKVDLDEDVMKKSSSVLMVRLDITGHFFCRPLSLTRTG
ncbi:tripartite motif-containing protein 54-like isoform X2 [Gigantopelta aegis]|uniref:tripartite motif-containing protein 54-like isoform X2 n=1 Tax=Gigantopelta aegis TaxID=1735272 RepID=UPI001B88D0E3|nr:tripartite motif-containing protein 54-like isoform X2 [Gigantopelta aegis]